MDGDQNTEQSQPIEQMDTSGAATDSAADVSSLEPVSKSIQDQYSKQDAAPQPAVPQQPTEKQPLKLSELLQNKTPDAPNNQPQKLSDLLNNYQGERPNFALAKTARELAPDWMGIGSKELTPGERLWVKNQPEYKILDAFGMGWKSAMDSGSYLDPDTVKGIKELGAWDGIVEGDKVANNSLSDILSSTARNIYESTRQTYVTPAIVGAAGLLNFGVNALMAAPFEGVETAAAEAGKELAAKGIGTGTELPAAVEYFATTAEGLGAISYGIPESVLHGVSSGATISEGVFTGAKEPTPIEAQKMNDAHAALPPEAAVEPPKTIHEVARSIDPITFQAYDTHVARREVLRDRYAELREDRNAHVEDNAPHNEEIQALKDKIEEANPRKAKIYQAKIDDLNEKNEAWKADQKQIESPEMSAVKDKLVELDGKLQDIARTGRIARAYSEAQERMPAPAEPEIKVSAAPETVAEPAQPSAENHVQPSPEEQQRAHAAIASDVVKKLTDIGRPADEASAIAQLVASHYQTVAEQGWAKGTPEEIYNKHAAEIKAGKGRAKTLSQPEAGKTLLQKAKGKIRLGVDGAKNIISLFKTADASTFVHELGHHWLEEMMTFASDAEAPQSIKDHVSTVRDWLGAKDGEEITTRQHEKFARGFERYLMEGTAPSKGLAKVFAQFKEWLTKIYQTVDRLKSPITDDIRNVFDRLIVSNPEKTVIAPEHAAGDKLAEMHEKVASEAPPHEAAAAADDTEKEIDSLAKKTNPEIANAIKSGEAGNITEASGESNIPSAKQQPEPQGQGSAEKPAEVSGGVSGAAAEGTSGGAGEESYAATGRTTDAEQSGSEREPGPNTPTKPTESGLVDKAGNIRLDNLNAAEDVKQALRDLAAQNDDFQAARGGVVSVSQRSAMADSLGLRIDQFDPKQLDGIPPSIAADALQKLTFQATESLAKIGKEFAENGSEENWAKYLQSKQRLLMIADHFSTVTAEAGRTLKVFDKSQMKLTEDVKSLLQHESGKDLFQMQREAKLVSALDTTAKRARMLQASRKASFGDMILEYWINGLISGPATHATYAVGNTLLAVWRAVPESVAAAGISKVHELVGNNASGITIGEVGAKVRGAVESIPTAISATGSALKTGVTTLLPGEEPWTLPFQTQTSNPIRGVTIPNKNISWADLGSQTYGAIKGMRDGFIGIGTLIKNGGIEGAPIAEIKRSALGAIPNIAVKGVEIPVGDTLRIPGRSVAAIHSFFRTVNYSIEKSAIAYRTASKENLSGLDFAKRVNDIEVNPSENIMKSSRSLATEATLMARGGELTQALSKITNLSVNLPILGETKLLKFIDPFVHISSNILDQTLLQRTPLGILSKEMRDDLLGKNGAEIRDVAQAKMLVGTALAATAGGLAAEGLMSGSGPSNAHQRGIWIAAGNQPHSVRIGDVWYDIHRLGPLGGLMSIGADMYDVAHAMGKEDASTVATMIAHAISQNVLDESFMRGPAELIQATTDSERYGPQYIRNFASSFLPYSVGMSQIARAVDPYARQARTTMDAFKAKIPYMSEELMPRRDVWGEPVPNKDVLGIKGLSAIYETRINNDPVNKALLSLGLYPAQPGRKIRGVELSDEQYDTYSKMAGKVAKQRLDMLVSQPSFPAGLPGQKIHAMQGIINDSRELARRAVMMQYPDIMQKAIDQKSQILMGKK